MSKKKTEIDPKLWLTIRKGRKKKNPEAPKKESSGDDEFDKAIKELLNTPKK